MTEKRLSIVYVWELNEWFECEKEAHIVRPSFGRGS